MSQWAIVAIPTEQDYVWKVSSEKVPHMTLLFLGEQGDNPNEAKMAEFLEHVAKTSLPRFGLSVDRRGTLGPDNADVLFFQTKGWQKKQIERLQNLRMTLLQDDDIAAAYNSVDQYPEWTPHLTLGYPETPAKEDKRDYPGFSWIEFDRLALWTSDSSGPEFVLEGDDMALAMNDAVAEFLAHQGIDVEIPNDDVNEFLAHYGVPGMKWGRRAARGVKTAAKTVYGKQTFDGKHSITKAALVKKYGRAKDYTDPQARELRVQSGRLALTGLLVSGAGKAVKMTTANSANPSVRTGGKIASAILSYAGGLAVAGGAGSGVAAVALETRSRGN